MTFRKERGEPIIVKQSENEMTIAYFKGLTDEVGVSYQNLINLYRRECASEEKKPSIKWHKTGT